MKVLMQEWGALWIHPDRAGDADPLQRRSGAHGAWEDLPPITMGALGHVLASYGEGTGPGWDRLRPRQLRWLPLHYRQAFLDIVQACERNPTRCPLWLLLVAFLPKPPPGGGKADHPGQPLDACVV